MVPQLDILSQASVFITHAGMGGTGEAIYYGVPMIAIPQMEEQAITARQIESWGWAAPSWTRTPSPAKA